MTKRFAGALVTGLILTGIVYAGTNQLPELPPLPPLDEIGNTSAATVDSTLPQAILPVTGAEWALPDALPSSGTRLTGMEKGAPAPLPTESARTEEPIRVRRVCPQGSDDAWRIPQPCFLQNLGIQMGGWLEQGMTFNAQDPADHFNGPVATNDLDSEYQMNQLWLWFHRPADNGGCGFAWGGHVDIMYGTDWRFGINEGLEDRINGFDYQTYGLVIPQFYLELAYNRLSVKLGHFAGILDYEAVPGPMNPFYSHSYSYGYTVPQLVTGVLADYKLTDQLSIQGGFHRGWMKFEDNNNELDFMGGVKWKSWNERLTLAYAVSAGAQDDAGDQDRFVYSFVGQYQVNKRFKYIFVHNLGTENNALHNRDDAEWYGINQYFLYTINPCWSAGMRIEWMRDDDGVRIAGPGNIPGVRAWSGRGFAGDFYEITWGLNWRPNGNWTIRPELRYDWYDGLAGPTGMPFDNGSKDHQLTVGIDAIFSF